MKTLPKVPDDVLSGTGKYHFTDGTIKGVLYAADKAIMDRKGCAAAMPTRNQLAAIMLSIPVHEIDLIIEEGNARSPMTLSRWDNLSQFLQRDAKSDNDKTSELKSLNIRLFSHMTEVDNLRAHWAPGVGLWQIDPFDTTKHLNHAQRADITNGGVYIAEYLLGQLCTSVGALKAALNNKWHGCDKNNMPDRCYNTYLSEIYDAESDKLNIVRVAGLKQVDGGVTERLCRWSSDKVPMPCYLYNPEMAEGVLVNYHESGQIPTGSAAPDFKSGPTPLPLAFISFTDSKTEIKYAVWPKLWPHTTGITSWPYEVVTTGTTIYRAVMPSEVVRCSPGRDETPESGDEVSDSEDCAEGIYYPFGENKVQVDVSGENKIISGWFNDSVPYAGSGSDIIRHSLQLSHCGTVPNIHQPHVLCWWKDV
ncbi:hypothetical protein [Candidatus Poriferisocius sp.]|uniref:hypothetical protein n=1 Tax=Candidatus Poriferisocius sp. TaxID=3101276 RepID=UPI003B5C7CB0